jgi:hypothetical protein
MLPDHPGAVADCAAIVTQFVTHFWCDVVTRSESCGNRWSSDPTPSDAPCAVIRRLARVTGEVSGTPNLLFPCGWYRRALAGWHRLASGLVRPREDTHCLRSSSDRWAGRCGVIVYVSVTFMDAMTPSVSVISDTHDFAAVGVNEVRGCTQMIAGCWTD